MKSAYLTSSGKSGWSSLDWSAVKGTKWNFSLESRNFDFAMKTLNKVGLT